MSAVRCTRVILRWLVLCTAVVWLGLNAFHLLESNFELPFGFSWWHRWLATHPRLNELYHWFADRAWPWLVLVLVIMLRQETHRWFHVRRGRRSADRLIVGWFVFIATVALLDWLAPDIRIHWPATVIETSVWLLMFCGAAWVSRMLHPATRRRLQRAIKRWYPRAVFDRMVKAAHTRDEQFSSGKGAPSHALPKPKARRAG